jgi:hypothetical protein
MDLNEGQKAAVEYGIGVGRPSAPLLIIAGAGTGKTKTLPYFVDYSFRQGTGMGRRVHTKCRGWLHTVRHGGG